MSYRSRVIADGASHYWRLSEQAGSSALDSVGTAHGSISALGVTLAQPGAISVGLNTAMAFDDANSGQVFFGALAVPVPVTVEAWINLPVDGSYRTIFSCRNATTGLFFGIGGGTLQVFNGAGANVGGPTSVTDGTWHHVAAVLNGTTATLYRDGVQDGAPAPCTLAPTTNLSSLSYDAGADGLRWKGLLDEVALYPKALSAAEIAAHFNARNELEPAGGDAGVPGWWMVGEDGGEDLMRFNTWRTVTPSNTVDFPRPSDAILVGAGGDIAAVMQNNVVVVLTLPAGAWVPIVARRINATGTTATGLIALNNA